MGTFKVWRGDSEKLKQAVGKRYITLKNPEPNTEIWVSRFAAGGKLLKAVLSEPFSFEYLVVQMED